ncbi:MAG: DUF4407 domain-containing protein [Bacteroidota bacterium]
MELHPIAQFFCFCSGTSIKVLQECPTENNKYISIGATVFFTGILAALSGSYALFTVFNTSSYSIFIAIPFGIFWGLLIFNLDRYIVSSLKKKGSKWKELSMALPRFLVALIIAMVVAKPLEIRIFKDRIERQIHENKLHKLVDDKVKINEIYQQDKLSEKLIKKNNEIAQIEKKLNTLPQGSGFERINEKFTLASSAFEKAENFQKVRIKQIQNKIANIYQDQPNRLFDAKGRLIAESVSPTAFRKIQALNKEAYQIRLKTKEKEQVYLKAKDEFEQLIAAFKEEVIAQMTQAKKEQAALNKQKSVADSLAYSQFVKGNKVNQSTYQANFITQLEALGSLTKDKFSTMWWASLFISLLFIMVETSPIVVKLLAEKGPYEMILERHEYEVRLLNQRKITKLKEHINQGYFLDQLNVLHNEKTQVPTRQKEAEISNINQQGSTTTPTVTTKDQPQKHITQVISPKKIAVEDTTTTQKYIGLSTQLEGITWKKTNNNNACCYVFRQSATTKPGEFLLIANGDVRYGEWNYLNKNELCIKLEGEKTYYEIRGINQHYLQLKKRYEQAIITFKRM